MKSKTSEQPYGFTLVDLLLIVAAMISLAVIALPYLARTHHHSPGISCSNNLKQVGLAFRIWAGDNNDQFPTQISITNGGAMEAALTGNVAVVFQVMSNELASPKILYCPTAERGAAATTFDSIHPQANLGVRPFTSNTNVSYFVGLDAKVTYPSMFLTGDDNFLVGDQLATPGILTLKTNSLIAWSDSRHKKQGNVGLADGSVQQLSSRSLRQHSEAAGMETNRLALP